MTRLCLLWPTLILTGCSQLGPSDHKDDGNILARHQVTRGRLDVVIIENGALESDRPVEIKSGTRGKIAFVVDDGSEVKKGDKVLALDTRDQEERVDQKRLDLDRADYDQKQAEAALALHQLEAASKLEEAARATRFAKMALTQHKEGTAPMREKELRLAVEKASLDLEDAKEKAGRMPAMQEKGFVTAREVRQAVLAAREAEQTLERKQSDLKVFLEYEQPQKLAELQGALEKASLAEKRQQQTVTTEREQKEGELHSKAFAVEAAKRALTKLQDDLAQMTIKAPADGIVVHGSGETWRWGSQSTLTVGDDVNTNSVLMRIPDLTAMIVKAGVNEASVARIQVGQPVTVKVGALGNRIFHGKVRKVATTATENWRRDVKEYATEITLDDAQGTVFRPGISCEVQILVERLDDTVQAPVDAVYERDRLRYCWLAGPAGQPVRQPVEVGPASPERVAIRKGLEAGQTVLVLLVEPNAAGK